MVYPFMPMGAILSSAGTDPTGGRVESQRFCSTHDNLRCRASKPSAKLHTVLLLAYGAASADRMVQLLRP